MTKLFVITGDSNAVGFNLTAADLPAHLTTAIPKAYIFGGTYWGALTPGVNTGTSNNPGAWGPESQLAYSLGQQYPGETLLFVKVAKGSTALAQNDGLDWSPNSVGEMFDTTTATIQAAKAAYEAAQGKPAPDVSGVFWVAGPNDAFDYGRATAYQDNLGDLFEAIRDEWMDDPNGLIVYSRMTDGAAMPHNHAVRVAQWAEDQTDGNAYSFKTIGYDMAPDAIHYSAAGTVQLGAGLADGWAVLA